MSQKRHSRNVSDNRIVLPRRNTRDPLAPKDGDPLAGPPTPIKKSPSQPTSKPIAILSEPPKDFSHLLLSSNFSALPLDSVPPPFRRPPPDPSTSLPSLLEGGQFRAAAIQAAALLTATPPPSQDDIFRLLYTRLSCLQLLNLTSLAAQESRCLQDLTSPFYLTSERKHVLPWELRVLATRLQAISFSDMRKAVMGYYVLAGDARAAILAPAASEAESGMWRARLADLGVRVANALVEMGDLVGAGRHLATLAGHRSGEEDRSLVRGRLGLVYLRIGNLAEARRWIVDEEGKGGGYAEVLRPLLSVAEGNFGSAAKQMALGKEGREGVLSRGNLAVALVYGGEMRQAREVLEEMVEERETSSTLLFNLATVFELCTEKSRALKVGLVEKVAENDGGVAGWERALWDFKL